MAYTQYVMSSVICLGHCSVLNTQKLYLKQFTGDSIECENNRLRYNNNISKYSFPLLHIFDHLYLVMKNYVN